MLADFEVLEFKKEYNTWLKKHWKAAIYLDDNNIPISKREKWLPEYRNILNNLNRLLNTFDIYNIRYSADEVLGGFILESEAEHG